MAFKLTLGNFKGGVGKSATTTAFAYILDQRKKGKTLLIDIDPQGDSTKILQRTYESFKFDDGVAQVKAFHTGKLRPAVTKVSENLDIIQGGWALSGLEDYFDNFKKMEKWTLLATMLKPLEKNYDYILFDTPPSLTVYAHNAVVATNWVVICLQTQRSSFDDSKNFVQELANTRDLFDLNLNLLGVIPYMFSNGDTTDNEILPQAQKFYGKAMFHEVVKRMARIGFWHNHGINTNHDAWDKKALVVYETLLNEIILRKERLEQEQTNER